MDIRHEPEGGRVVASLGAAEAVLEYRPAGAGVLEYFHTFVPDELCGKGIASELVEFALEYAGSEGFEVIPTCPFVARVMRAEPRYRDRIHRGSD